MCTVLLEYKKMIIILLFQCFDTIEQAYSFVDAEEMETPLILVHSGVYQGEYLFVDTNVSIIGAGKLFFE